ncbi:MAG: amidohydrolase family protein [Blastocatellia bacterium]|nr:amidohydrolase family protein [Blastocatellia bacterium]
MFFEKPFEKIAGVCAAHPNRFKGIIGVNPSKIMTWIDKLERSVKEFGFVGAHIYPHWFGAPPDDRMYYPFYAKCAELRIPVQIQVGIRRSGFCRPSRNR